MTYAETIFTPANGMEYICSVDLPNALQQRHERIDEAAGPASDGDSEMELQHTVDLCGLPYAD